MIELYAITEHPGPPLPEIAPLAEVPTRGLAVICGPADDGEPTPERMWRHEEVLEALMADRDVLPVRYGTRAPDPDAAARAVAARYEELRSALAFIRGAVELAVRAIDVEQRSAPAQAQPARSGTEYLRAGARKTGAETHAARAIHEPLLASSRAGELKQPRVAGEVLRASYLVEAEGVQAFVALLERLERANPTLRISCTGPWPPYSFAER